MPVTNPIATFDLDAGGYVESDNILPAPSNRLTHDNVEYRFLNAAATGTGEITVRFSPVVTTRRSGIGYFAMASGGVHPSLEGVMRFTPVDGPSTGANMSWAAVRGLVFTESAYPAPALNFNTANLIDTWEGAEIGDPNDQIAVFPLDRDDLSAMPDEVLFNLTRYEREFQSGGDGFSRVRSASVRAAGDTSPTEWTVEDAYATGEDTSAIARLRLGLQLVYVPTTTNAARTGTPSYWGLEGAAICVEDASNATLLDTVLPAPSEGVLDAATGVWTFVLGAESGVTSSSALTGGTLQIGTPPEPPYRSVFAFTFAEDEWVLDDIESPSGSIRVGELPISSSHTLFGAASDGDSIYLAAEAHPNTQFYRLDDPGDVSDVVDLGTFFGLLSPTAIALFDGFLYLWQSTSPHLRRIPLPVTGQTFQNVGDAPVTSGTDGPRGMTAHYGSLFFLNAGINSVPHLWRMDRPINPSNAVDLGAVTGTTVEGFGSMNSVFSHGGSLYIAGYDSLWRVPDVTDATTAVRVGDWPFLLGALISATSHPFARPPDFGDADFPDQAYTTGTSVSYVLPEASHGYGDVSHLLSPSVPAGLTYSETLRRIQGTPTAAAAEDEYTYTALDALNRSAAAAFDLSVVADLVPTLPPIFSNAGIVGSPLSIMLPAATGGNLPITYTAE